MKTVFLVRHAKSSWDHMGIDDIDRPLNERGLRDAPFMANLLKQRTAAPDRLVSSPANRAFTTATFFANAFQIDPADILKDASIYEAYTEELMYVIQHFDPQWNTICLFGHNPGFTNVANLFSSDFIPNIPTCGIVKLTGVVDDWSEFAGKKVKVDAFYYPKLYY
ncbi:MAG: histidine phosphatase family protein [Saprospiraceae bacterium]